MAIVRSSRCLITPDNARADAISACVGGSREPGTPSVRVSRQSPERARRPQTWRRPHRQGEGLGEGLGNQCSQLAGRRYLSDGGPNTGGAGRSLYSASQNGSVIRCSSQRTLKTPGEMYGCGIGNLTVDRPSSER